MAAAHPQAAGRFLLLLRLPAPAHLLCARSGPRPLRHRQGRAEAQVHLPGHGDVASLAAAGGHLYGGLGAPAPPPPPGTGASPWLPWPRAWPASISSPVSKPPPPERGLGWPRF